MSLKQRTPQISNHPNLPYRRRGWGPFVWTPVLAVFIVLLALFNARIAAHALPVAKTPAQRVGAAQEGWVPPIKGATPSDVLKPFVPPSMPWSPAHRGIDLASSNGVVVAPADGTVRFVGTVVDRPVITIEHSNGMLSSMEPVSSELDVGDTVKAGAVIGEIAEGVSHCEQSCVHWGLRIPDGWLVANVVRDLYIDPGALLGWTKPSVLWPIESDPPWA